MFLMTLQPQTLHARIAGYGGCLLLCLYLAMAPCRALSIAEASGAGPGSSAVSGAPKPFLAVPTDAGATGVGLQPPPLTPGEQTAPAPASGPVPAASAASQPPQTPPGLPAPPETVTLMEAPEVDRQLLLNQVLQASVTKTSNYPVDLATVLRLVQEQSLAVSRDTLAARIQGNNFYRSLSDMLPDILGNFQHTWFRGGVQIIGDQVFVFEQVRIIPQVTARLTIFPGGQQVFQALAARRRQQGLQTQTRETLQQQMAAAASDYYTLIEGIVDVQNAQLSLQEAQSQVDFNDARLRAGVGTKLDAMRARSQLAQRQLDLIRTQNQLARSEQALLNRLNLDPEIHLIPLETTAQPKLLVPLNLSSDELLAMALANHPNLKRNEQEMKALRADSLAVLGRIVPTVTLEFYQNATGPTYDNLTMGRFRGLFLESNLLENLGTDIPLAFRGVLLQMRQKAVERQILVRDIQSGVVDAYLNSRSLAQAILAAREELSAAEEAYRQAVGRYRAGLGLNVDVIDAQTALYLARTRLAESILGFNRSQVDLLRAMGVVTPGNVLFGLPSPAAAPTSP